MKRLALLVTACLVMAAVIAGAGGLIEARLAPPTRSDIGGPFTLVDQNGRTVTNRDLLGKPTAMYFGFTYCPEACPTTLAHLTAWMSALGPAADRLNVVFVTIDPARDRPAQLKAYLSSFDPRIRGLTGTEAQVNKVAAEYHVYHRKVALSGGDYTVDHSTAIYLMDAKGRFVEPIGYDAPPAAALASLRRLLRS